METTREELLQAGDAEVDSTTDYSPDRLSQFPSYLKVVILPLVNYGYHLLPVFKRKLWFWQMHNPSQISIGSSSLSQQWSILSGNVQKVWYIYTYKTGSDVP